MSKPNLLGEHSRPQHIRLSPPSPRPHCEDLVRLLHPALAGLSNYTALQCHEPRQPHDYLRNLYLLDILHRNLDGKCQQV